MQAKSWIILTGHSRGMGLAMARLALQRGHAVLGISRHVQGDLVGWAHQHQTHLEQWAQDLSDTQEAATRLRQWLTTLHASDVDRIALVNNAALLCTPAPLEDTETQALIASTRVGLEAPLVLCQSFLSVTKTWVREGWRGDRRIMNISSGLGRRAMASSGPYCAVKAGLDHLTRCIQLDQSHQEHGAQVESIAPGVIATDMQVQLRRAPASQFPDVARFVDLQEQGMLATPEQAAAQLLDHLASASFGHSAVSDVRAL
jgi:benzil reductase ((S)-benzoin forming)